MSWGLIAWFATVGLVVWIFDHPPSRGTSAQAAPQGDLFAQAQVPINSVEVTTMQPSFAWASSYMGCVTYRVHDETGIYEIEVRREVTDYERSIYNGTAVELARDLVGAIGLMRRSYNSSLPIPPATVAAFNAWRTAEHVRLIADIERRWAKYHEVLLADDLVRVPPPPVRGAHYEIGRGWIRAGDEVTDDPRSVGRIGIGDGDRAGDA